MFKASSKILDNIMYVYSNRSVDNLIPPSSDHENARTMRVCSETCRKWCAFSVAVIFAVLGILAVFFWESLFNVVLKKELTLPNSRSTGFNMWKETPIPMYIEFYLFNWTNSKEVLNDWSVKPNFEECGPYTFSEHHVRVNVEWNENGTLAYQQKRIWKYLPEKSKGSLEDKITNLNIIVATVAYTVRNEHYLVKRGVNFFLKEKEGSLVTTHTVDELLFKGYEDPLLVLAKKLNISGLNIPFDKFGWFYGRNESETYDGNFTMYTGETDILKLGVISRWNGVARTHYFEGACGDVNGTSGELWPPVEDDKKVYIFAPDTCSSIPMSLHGTDTIHGLDGKKFVCTDEVFDNGTKYPDMGCFSSNVPSGTRNVSLCKFGAPAFISFPHFYLADPSYRAPIQGMHPNKSEHEFFISLEPHTGIPLQVRAQMQINILIEQIPGIDMLKNVRKMYVPTLWFRQSAMLTEEYASMAKMLLVLPSVGTNTGYGMLAFGILLLAIVAFITLHRGWKKQEGQRLLPPPQTI